MLLQYEHSGEHINSRDANTIADIIRHRLEKLSPRLHNTPKVAIFSVTTQSLKSLKIESDYSSGSACFVGRALTDKEVP